MNQNIIQKIKGTRDFYPEDMKKRDSLINTIKKVVVNYGYEEYMTPILESMDLYAAKSSVEIIEKQSYVLEDRSGEKLVLRPEMTPSLARLVATKQAELPGILRWYSFPECWRYEAPQKGRLRNFLQLNVDLLGSDSIEADAEIIEISIKILKALGINMKNIVIKINDRALMSDFFAGLSIPIEKQSEIFSLLDKKEKISPEEFSETLTTLGMSEETKKVFLDAIENPDKILSRSQRGTRVQTLLEILAKNECKVVFDPTIARGFSYYTGIVFEVFETSGSFRRSVFGGGRYDNLLESVGGKPVSGIGFGISDIVIETVLLEQKINIPLENQETFMVIPFSEAELLTQQQIAKTLRDNNLRVVSALPPYTLKKQLKIASELGINQAILILPEELKRGGVIVRDMKTGEQREISIDALNQKLTSGE